MEIIYQCTEQLEKTEKRPESQILTNDRSSKLCMELHSGQTMALPCQLTRASGSGWRAGGPGIVQIIADRGQQGVWMVVASVNRKGRQTVTVNCKFVCWLSLEMSVISMQKRLDIGLWVYWMRWTAAEAGLGGTHTDRLHRQHWLAQKRAAGKVLLRPGEHSPGTESDQVERRRIHRPK